MSFCPLSLKVYIFQLVIYLNYELMMPDIKINFLAILIAVVANFFLGFLWYTPLFGKVWAREMGYDTTDKSKNANKELIKGMIFMVIGNFLMAWVFAHNIAVWNPVTWGLEPSPMAMHITALMSAIFTWLGFYFPTDLGSTVWDRRSWKVFFINTGYHLATLIVASFIITYMS